MTYHIGWNYVAAGLNLHGEVIGATRDAGVDWASVGDRRAEPMAKLEPAPVRDLDGIRGGVQGEVLLRLAEYILYVQPFPPPITSS